jgi:beta-glucosidase
MGSRPGAEVLQLYVSAPNSPTQRPVKELQGFEKVFLQPGEEKTAQIKIDKYATSFWDESEGKWCSEKGEYKVIVGTSSMDPECLVGTLVVEETRWWLGL